MSGIVVEKELAPHVLAEWLEKLFPLRHRVNDAETTAGALRQTVRGIIENYPPTIMPHSLCDVEFCLKKLPVVKGLAFGKGASFNRVVKELSKAGAPVLCGDLSLEADGYCSLMLVSSVARDKASSETRRWLDLQKNPRLVAASFREHYVLAAPVVTFIKPT